MVGTSTTVQTWKLYLAEELFLHYCFRMQNGHLPDTEGVRANTSNVLFIGLYRIPTDFAGCPAKNKCYLNVN